MSRNVKVLSFAVFAVLVITGVPATGASAQEIGIRSDGPVTLTATETGEASANGFTILGESYRCPGSTYTGHLYDATPHEPIPSGEPTATITPTYKQSGSNCKASGGLSVTIDMNGCDYVLNVGGEVSEDKFATTTDIVCPEEKSIQLTVFSSGTHALRLCTLTIKAQVALAGIYAKTTTAPPEDFDLEGTLSGIHVARSGLCGSVTTTEGELDLDLTVKGLSGKGLATAVAIGEVDLPEIGIRSDGPVTLTATETGEASANGFTMFGESIRCPGSTYTGHKYNVTPHELIPSGEPTATITPTYKNCSSGSGLSVTIDMNGCDYVLNVDGTLSEHTYAVSTDIVCPEEKSIQLTIFSSGTHALKVCTNTIKAQTGLTGIYAKTTTTPPEDFDLEGTLSGIHVARSGLCGAATTTEGKLDLDLTFKGLSGKGLATAVAIGEVDLPEIGIRSDGPVTLTATETGEASANGFTILGEPIRCPGSTYTGHLYDATPHEPIPSGEPTATITPTYKNCSSGSLSVTIDMNGCDYVLNVGGKVSEDTYAATTDIACPAEKSIQLTIFSSGTHALKVCTLAIKAQTGLTGIYAKTTTTPPEDFDLEGTLTGIHAAKSGVCGATTTTEGELDLDLTVNGLDGEGEATAVAIGT
ncbi:MAG TPA: hypothetical protein VFM94_10865 [Solirubrobacterales bacterium]|nr:hypothetical protein [Solirubrobacterales bacterium]